MAPRRNGSTDQAGQRASLGEETRALVRARIVEGAASALADRGFSATVDDIADAAGVSRRTVFRHFPTHDDVVRAAVSAMREKYDRSVATAVAKGTRLDDWLLETAVAMHELNRRIMGWAFWEINVVRPGIHPAQRSERRWKTATLIANQGWRLAGGTGRAPSWVVDAFALQMSGFASNCLDKHDVEQAGRVSARILTAVLTEALRERPPRAGKS